MTLKYIVDFKEYDRIRGVYLCKSVNTLKAKTGKSYMSLNLQDKTGNVDAKIWDLNNGIGNFEAMDYIYIEGEVTVFQGSNQLKIDRVRKAQDGEYNVGDYMPTTSKDVKEMYRELMALINSVKEEHLSVLLKSFFADDNAFIKKFANHSAAKAIHHKFIGGLLEHTLGVAKICDFLAQNYPIINRDLLITAAIFHDVGKLMELSEFPENDYTDEGNLLGHIYMGAELVGERIKQIDGFPAVLANELKHCILAHHGELEFGSPKKPSLVEALALSMADNLDAKLETMRGLLESPDADNGWLGYQKIFESNIRKTHE